MLKLISKILLIIFLILPLVGFCTSSHEHRVLILADIHFNPFLGCPSKPCNRILKLNQTDAKNWATVFEDNSPVSKLGEDTNYSLLKSTLLEVKKESENKQLQFGMVLGDWLGHRFRSQYQLYSMDRTEKGYQLFVKKTFQFLTNEISKALPHVTILPMIGNNDSYMGNYEMLPGGTFFNDMSMIWSSLFKDKLNQAEFRQAFPESGYYSYAVDASNRVIVLNSVLFSINASGEGIRNAARGELSWLDEQLTIAEKNKQSVWLALHIPMGVNIDGTIKSLFKTVQFFWKEPDSDLFWSILEKHRSVVKTILAGHIHKDAFQIISFKDARIPISYIPSISPIYGNNPGFKVYNYKDQSFNLQNFDVYYLPIKNRGSVWTKEYSFNRTYQFYCPSCDVLVGLLKLTPKEMREFLNSYYMVTPTSNRFVSKNEFPYYECGVNYFTYKDYHQCLKEQAKQSS